MSRISVDSALLDALIEAGSATAQEMQDICDEAATCTAATAPADETPAPFGALEIVGTWERAFAAFQADLEHHAS